jgi:hypothetical protein
VKKTARDKISSFFRRCLKQITPSIGIDGAFYYLAFVCFGNEMYAVTALFIVFGRILVFDCTLRGFGGFGGFGGM